MTDCSSIFEWDTDCTPIEGERKPHCQSQSIELKCDIWQIHQLSVICISSEDWNKNSVLKGQKLKCWYTTQCGLLGIDAKNNRNECWFKDYVEQIIAQLKSVLVVPVNSYEMMEIVEVDKRTVITLCDLSNLRLCLPNHPNGKFWILLCKSSGSITNELYLHNHFQGVSINNQTSYYGWCAASYSPEVIKFYHFY